MDTTLVARGIVLGFAIAAPVGPIGLLCIRRTLTAGPAHGLASGLGAASADALYGSIAAFGLTAVSQLLVGQQTWLRLGGGLFLVYLGLGSLLNPPGEQAPQIDAATTRGLLAAYTSALVLTLTNPMTILSFTAMLASMGLADAAGQGGWLVVGVFTGSALWWLLLSSGVGLLRRKVGPVMLVWISRLSGLVIVGFGLWALVAALR